MAKKNYNRQSEQQQPKMNAEARALELFGEMLIKKIESFKGNWKKPWFTDSACTTARNLSGRAYNGFNAFMLAMHCEEKGYELPFFSTFERVQAMNRPSDNKTKNADPLPFVTVNKGERSFPVFLTTHTIINSEGKKISYDEFITLSNDDRDKCKTYPSCRIFNVFNIAQTNIAEARPEFYAKLKQGISKPITTTHDDYTLPEVDRLLERQLWYCPISFKYGDDAYYSISRDEIVLPKKEQFASSKAFYGTMFHEMSHSTGTATRLAREGVVRSSGFASNEYAHEEFIAEVSAAMTGLHYGLTKYVKEDSVAYLKSWLDNIKQDPKYIKTILKDARKASDMIIHRIENPDLIIGQRSVNETADK